MSDQTDLPNDSIATAEDAPAAPDHLADIFARQAALAEFYREQRPDGFYSWAPLDRCLMWTRSIIHETCELDDELNWKPWKNPRPLAETRAARLDEMADILHFFVQLALDQGFDAQEMYAAYLRKNAANRERQRSDPRYQPGQGEAAGEA